MSTPASAFERGIRYAAEKMALIDDDQEPDVIRFLTLNDIGEREFEKRREIGKRVADAIVAAAPRITVKEQEGEIETLHHLVASVLQGYDAKAALTVLAICAGEVIVGHFRDESRPGQLRAFDRLTRDVTKGIGDCMAVVVKQSQEKRS